MAVENHPLFPKWKAALERLLEASDRLKDAKGKSAEALAQKDYDAARAAYDKIADEV